jgi:hypothetical protein
MFASPEQSPGFLPCLERNNKPPRCHMFEEKREAVMAIEAAALPLMPG